MELTGSDQHVEDLIMVEHESGGNMDKKKTTTQRHNFIISVFSVLFGVNEPASSEILPVLPETGGTLEWGTFTRPLGSSFRASNWTETFLSHHLMCSLVRGDIPVGDRGVFTIWQQLEPSCGAKFKRHFLPSG